jgi:hypothetical protein
MRKLNIADANVNPAKRTLEMEDSARMELMMLTAKQQNTLCSYNFEENKTGIKMKGLETSDSCGRGILD